MVSLERPPDGINDVGFLSPSLSNWVTVIKRRFAHGFALIDDLNRLGLMQLASIPTGAPNDKKKLVSAVLFIRALTSLQGAVVLVERSLTRDAGTLLRSAFETIFCLGATVHGHDLGDNLFRVNLKTRRKIAREMLSFPAPLRPASPFSFEFSQIWRLA